MGNSYRRGDLKATGKIGAVYLLHLSEPYKHCTHCVGFTSGDPEDRLWNHNHDHGAALTDAAHRAGIEMVLARVWQDVDAVLEYVIKTRAESPRLCPICNPDAYRLAQYPEFAIGEPVAIEFDAQPLEVPF